MAKLTIEPTGETISVAEGQTMLDACLRHGIWLPHACGHGLCGTCKVTVIEGEVDHGNASSFALMDFERDEGRALACSASLQSDAVIEADIDEDEDARRIAVADYIGTISRTEMITPDIMAIWLALKGEGLDFQAGQYVNVTVPGVEGTRAFSLASCPSQANEIELHVKLVPGGAGTTWLHKNAKAGDTLAFSGPLGRFYVRRSAQKPLIFIAGGSGLSSPKSMILDLLASGYSEQITLLHGARKAHDLHYSSMFRELERTHENFRYVPVLSQIDEADIWEGETGHVHEAATRLFNGKFQGHQAYLCGPPLMIDAAIMALMQGRLFERDIYMEKFLSAADASSTTRSPLFKKI